MPTFMLQKCRLPHLITAVLCLEVAIYLWAVWTSTLDSGNFFAITSEFIFDKCARNSGRVSSGINLLILLLVGHKGLSAIFRNGSSRIELLVLITLFSINHLIHLFFVIQNFAHHGMDLSIGENLHGFLTFFLIVIVPVVLWMSHEFGPALYVLIIFHLLNISYFTMETFLSKVKPGKPAYHEQLGMAITLLACVYVMHSVVRDYKTHLRAVGVPRR